MNLTMHITVYNSRNTMIFFRFYSTQRMKNKILLTTQFFIYCFFFFSDAPNRTVCVGNLTRAVLRLEKEDFITFAKTTLNKTCKSSETECLEKRYLVLDVIAQAKTNASQQIIVDYVLSVNTSEEEVRRSLIHCIAVKQPVKVTNQLWRFAWGSDQAEYYILSSKIWNCFLCLSVCLHVW